MAGTTTTGTAATTPATTPAAVMNQNAANLQNRYTERANQNAERINGVYDSALNATRAGLKTAFDQSLAEQTAARDSIAGTYRGANIDLAIQYERNRRNLNEGAAANGINTGAGSQQQLALNQGYMKGFGQLRAGQAAATAEADRQIALLKTNYQNQLASALADNDYKRAAALLDDYKSEQTRADQLAQQMASYGNFTGYANLLGGDAATLMQQLWSLQNPDIAWAMGLLPEAQYQMLTGKKPHKASGKTAYDGWVYTGGGSGDGGDDDSAFGPPGSGGSGPSDHSGSTYPTPVQSSGGKF